ncbi:MAG: hypothetical protein HKL95_08075 [Phycisphaerae bacterium]|nr:hypothetical protein [Phycisphaerae bacterium]
MANDPAHGVSKFLGGQAVSTLATAGASELPMLLSGAAKEAATILPEVTTDVTDLAGAKTATNLSEDAIQAPTAHTEEVATTAERDLAPAETKTIARTESKVPTESSTAKGAAREQPAKPTAKTGTSGGKTSQAAKRSLAKEQGGIPRSSPTRSTGCIRGQVDGSEDPVVGIYRFGWENQNRH